MADFILRNLLWILIGGIAIVLVVAHFAGRLGPALSWGGLPKPYRGREDARRKWCACFPQAAEEEIRKFLDLFADAFAFPKDHRFKFEPSDQVMDVYRAVYTGGFLEADMLELETFARDLEREYGLKVLKFDTTLGGLFELATQSHKAYGGILGKPVPTPFAPGFRFSTRDAVALGLGAGLSLAIAFWEEWRLALFVAIPVAQFFLFCNIFRVARPLELAWAGAFILLAGMVLHLGFQWWPLLPVGSFLLGAVAVALEMRKPSYHGVGWERINPGLRGWWETQSK